MASMNLSLPAHSHGLPCPPLVVIYTESTAYEIVNLHLCAFFQNSVLLQSHALLRFQTTWRLDLQVHESSAAISGNCGQYVL